MRRLTVWAAVATTVAAFAVGGLAGPASAQVVAQPQIVSANPANWTPNVLDGAVKAFVQIGNTVVAGGTFSQVQAAGSGSPVLDRANLFAFNATTGAISSTFVPNPDGEVTSLVASPDGKSVYVGGYFNTISGQAERKVARIDLATGQRTAGFNAAPINSVVKDMRLVHGQLVIGGPFSTVGGLSRPAIASLDPTTGAVTGYAANVFADPRNDGALQIMKMDVTPDGSRLVVIGNFNTVDGLSRPQMVILDTSGSSTQVVDGWRTSFYDGTCSAVFDTYMRDLDIDPTGQYVVVSTTGAYHGSTGPCDVITRWEVNATGTDIQPTWRDYTGGDTTYAVAATGAAVYAGGHMRWLNNPYAGDAAGPGAVPREGIVALDPVNGLPFSWNPGRTRGVGVFDLLATPTGLWVGSDTTRIANELRQRLAFMPLAGGTPIPPYVRGALPNDVYLLGRTAGSADPSVLYRVNAGGPALQSVDDGPDWADGTGAPANNGNSASYGPVPTVDSSVPDSPTDRAPRALFDTERWSGTTNPEMQWSFPVTPGTHLQVRLYFANRYAGTSQPGQRVFDVAIDGTTVLSNLDLAAAYGSDTGHMDAFEVTSDGSVDISFKHVTENPLINGIEIVNEDVTPPAGGVTAADDVQRRFYIGSGAPGPTVVESGIDSFSQARGAFLLDGTVYAGWADGTFTARSYNGTAFGPRHTVDLYGGTFASDVANLTGLAYADGRIYYTKFGDNTLHYRYFTGESQVVGATPFTVGGDVSELQPNRVAGLFLSGDQLYFADRTSGALYRMTLSGGTVTGPAVLVDDTTDWRSRAMFVWSGTPAPVPNIDPTASATVSCTDNVCRFDGSGSADADGSVVSYAWDFGDGSRGTGVTPTHAYATAGPFTATLTVTDNAGGTATTTVVAAPTAPPNLAPTAAFTFTCDQLACSFDGSGSTDPDGSVASYAWDFADTDTGTGVSPSHTFAAPGTYPVTLVVTDNDGAASAPTSVDVTVVAQGANQPPTAAFTSSCTQLACSFDGSGSNDPDGTVAAYAWDFGDGSVSTQATPSHTYASAGTYSVRLVVTDNGGAASPPTTQDVAVTSTPPPASDIAFRASATVDKNASATSVRVPASVRSGDALLLFVSTNTTQTVTSEPAGWTYLGQQLDGSPDLRTRLYTRVATGADPGATVSVGLAGRSKTSLTLLAYSGAQATDPVAAWSSSAETGTGSGHTTPAVSVADSGSWLVSFWADKTSSSTGWTAPAGQSVRAQSVGSGGGRLVTLATDGGAATPAGPAGGLTATGSAASSKVTMWSVVLRPSVAGPPPVNQLPTAAFSFSCTGLACGFDGTGSSDPDGTVASYAWNFGDGSTGSGATPSHTYVGAGTYPVQLTVTDSSGGTSAPFSRSVTVSVPPTPSGAIGFRAGAVTSTNSASARVDVPATVQAGDGMLLFVSTNTVQPVTTPPAGWTLVGEQADGSPDMRTQLYSRVATAADAGSTVSVAFGGTSKTDLTLLAYTGTDPTDPVALWASSPEESNTADHTTPNVSVSLPGAWVVSYWADKTSSSSGWTAPAGQTVRELTAGTGGGRLVVLVTDGNGPAPQGPWSGLSASAQTASAKAVMFSVVLRPAP